MMSVVRLTLSRMRKRTGTSAGGGGLSGILRIFTAFTPPASVAGAGADDAGAAAGAVSCASTGAANKLKPKHTLETNLKRRIQPPIADAVVSRSRGLACAT